MKLGIIAMSSIALLWGGTATAQQVTGGSFELSYSAFTDETSVDSLTLGGSMEVAFSQSIAAQFDLAYHSFDAEADITSFTAHGIYHLNEQTSFGLFVGVEDAGTSNDYLGIEAGMDVQQFAGEAYYLDGDGYDGFGLHGEYNTSAQLSLGLDYDKISISDTNADLSTIKLSADYNLNSGAAIFAELGSARGEIDGTSGSETFVGIGWRLEFGADRGATFDRRGIGELVPGL